MTTSQQQTSTWKDQVATFFESPLYIVWIVSLFLGLFLRKFVRKMATPRYTKSTVEGLRTLIRDTLPDGQSKPKAKEEKVKVAVQCTLDLKLKMSTIQTMNV